MTTLDPPTVLVHRDAELLALAAAARLVTRLVDVQSARGSVSLVLTGGRLGIATLRALADSPARDAGDWSAVDLWWGDERFLPAGHPDRNESQARAAMLDRLSLDPTRVHPMPASDGPDGDDVDAAAARYADELAGAARPEDHGPVPQLDVVLLGMGTDGHVASLFPQHPATHDERAVVGVRGAPKPPPVRISLTFGTICSAREVWLVVAGEEKAPAVALALGGAGRMQVPAAGVSGRTRTLWLLDRSAAGKATALGRLASP